MSEDFSISFEGVNVVKERESDGKGRECGREKYYEEKARPLVTNNSRKRRTGIKNIIKRK